MGALGRFWRVVAGEQGVQGWFNPSGGAPGPRPRCHEDVKVASVALDAGKLQRCGWTTHDGFVVGGGRG